MKPVLLGAGSCIIEAILGHFTRTPGVADAVELHLSQTVGGGRPPVDPGLLSRCSIVIEEAAPWQGSGTLTKAERALLPEACTTITVPTLHFNSLWPLMTEDPRNQPEPGAPYGRIPFGMGDRIALKIVQSEPDPARRRALYDATDWRRTVNLARSHELETRNFFAREQGCDVRVAAYVLAHFRDRRLFYTHAHPTGELMYFVLAQLYALPALRSAIGLPYDTLIQAARLWSETSNVFRGEEAPVHPAVAAHFGLRWWHADLQYAWLNTQRSFDAWITWYLTYVPNQPDPPPPPSAERITIPVGPYLISQSGQLADRALLAPQAHVERGDFIVKSGLDLALAAHGALMNHTSNGHYDAPETLLGALRDASVLGTDGLVINRGQLLGDTFRLLTSGNTAPLIHAILPDGVQLQPGTPTITRTVPEPLFAGFAGGWHDFGVWMVATLPRLVAFQALRSRLPDLKIVLPQLPPDSFQAQTLALLGIGPDAIVTIGPTEAISSPLLYVTSAFDLWQCSPYGIVAARHLAQSAPGAPGTARRFLLIRGAETRPLQNRAAAIAALESVGFVSSQLGSLPLAERIRAVRAADAIVAEHGSDLACIMFARPGTPVLELCGPAEPQPLFWTIATNAGLPYGFIAGKPEPAGYSIPLDALAGAVATIRRMALLTFGGPPP